MYAQKEKYPQNYFRSPVDFPIKIAANFGELRPNHFHNGLDIRTGGKEGLPLYAVADGYVSRIKVAPASYGNVLYITHPNGYVSVYAHCQRFNDTIQAYVRKAQYLNEKFEIELFPDKKSLPVKKSDVIAFSGNTGSSQGPHLHFEIREEETEFTVNPLLFGLELPDNVPPLIRQLYIFPVDENSYVNDRSIVKKIPLVCVKGSAKLKVPEQLNLAGKIGFGIDAIDQQTGSANPNNIYSMELLIDGKQVFYSELDKVPFDENRSINSYCDYAIKRKTGAWVQKLYIDPGNKLNIYKQQVNRGVVDFPSDGQHVATIIARDIEGNASALEFKFNYKPISPTAVVGTIAPAYEKIFYHNKENTFKRHDIEINMPPYDIYTDVKFEYHKDSSSAISSPIHYVHNANTPVHTYYTIALKCTGIPEKYMDKAVVVCMDYNGTHARSEGGTIADNGFIVTRTRHFGRFKVSTDLVPPSISPVNILNGKNLSQARAIVLKMGDNLSGIKSYRGTIDDKWVLMEYDAKSATLKYTFNNEEVTKGRHHFKLVVIDYVGNEKIFEADFIR